MNKVETSTELHFRSIAYTFIAREEERERERVRERERERERSKRNDSHELFYYLIHHYTKTTAYELLLQLLSLPRAELI